MSGLNKKLRNPKRHIHVIGEGGEGQKRDCFGEGGKVLGQNSNKSNGQDQLSRAMPRNRKSTPGSINS